MLPNTCPEKAAPPSPGSRHRIHGQPWTARRITLVQVVRGEDGRAARGETFVNFLTREIVVSDLGNTDRLVANVVEATLRAVQLELDRQADAEAGVAHD